MIANISATKSSSIPSHTGFRASGRKRTLLSIRKGQIMPTPRRLRARGLSESTLHDGSRARAAFASSGRNRCAASGLFRAHAATPWKGERASPRRCAPSLWEGTPPGSQVPEGFPKKATPQRAAWRLQHSSGAGRGMAHCSAQPPGEAATEKRGGRPLVLWRMRHGRSVSAPEPVRFSVKKSPGERLSYADPHGLIPA